MKVSRHPATKRSTRWIRPILAVGLVALVVWKFGAGIFGEFDFNRLTWAVLAIQPIALIGLIVHSMRLGVLAGLPASKFRRPFSALLLSQGFNLVLPGRIAELFKATYLRAYAEVPLSRGMAAIVLERSVDLLIVAGLGLVGVALSASADNKLAFALAALVITALISIPLLEHRLSALANCIPWKRLRSFSQELLKHLAETVRTGIFYRGLALGIATWVASFANIYLFVNLAGSKPVDCGGILLLFVATTIGGAVPVLPGGFGSYEAAAILVLKSYGYQLDEALPFAIGMHLAQFVLPVLGGAFILSREHIGISALLRQIRKESEEAFGESRIKGK